MNEEPTKPPTFGATIKPPVFGGPKVTKPRAAKNKKSPPKPRFIDPGIAAIHAEAKAKVAEYRKLTASGRILKTILDKRLAQLTQDDRQKLFDALAETCTATMFPEKTT